MSRLPKKVLLRAFQTVTSPIFHELVLEVGGRSSRLDITEWGHWRTVDKFLEERFVNRGEFSLVIRTGGLCDEEVFRKRGKEAFPLLAGRGCVNFGMLHALADSSH